MCINMICKLFIKLLWIFYLYILNTCLADMDSYIYNWKDLCERKTEKISLQANPLYSITINAIGIIENCTINFSAPDPYVIGVSCYRKNNADCYYKIGNQNMKSELKRLCIDKDKELPKIMPRHMQLTTVDFNQECNLVFTVNAISLKTEICRDTKNFYPCEWELKDTVDTYSVCISRKLVCDGVTNCPRTGLDEVPYLCNTSDTNDESGAQLFQQRIEESVIKLHENVTNYIISTMDHEPGESNFNHYLIISLSIVAVALFFIIGLIIYIFKSLKRMRRTAEQQNNSINVIYTSSPVSVVEIEMETVIDNANTANDDDDDSPPSTTPADIANTTAEDEIDPPSYTSLFPPHQRIEVDETSDAK